MIYPPLTPQLKSKQLVGMLLMVYVRADLLPAIRDVQADAQGTGILGMMVCGASNYIKRCMIYIESVSVSMHICSHIIV
jgi:hypothetical protein